MRTARRRTRTIVLTLDGGTATVQEHRGGRAIREQHTLDEGSAPGALVRHVLRASRLLRFGRRCDLRLVWDPERLLLRRAATPQVDAASVRRHRHEGLGDIDPDGVTVRVAVDPPSEAAIEAFVRRRDVEGIAGALSSARVEGRASLDIGVLARTRHLIASVGRDLAGRDGIVVDITSSTVSVLSLEGGIVRDVRSAARTDDAHQVSAMLEALAVATPRTAGAPGEGHRDPSRRWFWVHVPSDHVESVRQACRGVIPKGMSADIAIVPSDALGSPPRTTP
jgi:hypothetical protein